MTEIDVLPPASGRSGRRQRTRWPQLDLHTFGDLVRHYPRRYVDRGKLADIARLELGEHVTVHREVEKVTLRDMRHRRRHLLQVVIADGNGRTAGRTFFNADKVQNFIRPGVRAAVLRQGLPDLERSCAAPTRSSTRLDEADGLRPFISIYPPTQARSTSLEIGAAYVKCSSCSTTRPTPCQSRCGGGGPGRLGQALRRVHLPETEADLHATATGWCGTRRWASSSRSRCAAARRLTEATANARRVKGGLLDAFDARLPYTLTAGQRTVGAEIAADLASRGIR